MRGSTADGQALLLRDRAVSAAIPRLCDLVVLAERQSHHPRGLAECTLSPPASRRARHDRRRPRSRRSLPERTGRKRLCAGASGKRQIRRAADEMTPFPWLAEPPLNQLLAVLDADGEEARVVGGAVRNALLGEPVTEWDLATTATPDIVSARARRAGWVVAPTGVEHGTVTVVIDRRPFEVT